MFFGPIPTKCIEQIFRVIPFDEWDRAYVCCSGSFKVEQALSRRYPQLPILSNDVSLYTTAIAQAVLQQPIKIKFQGRLIFVEQYLKDQPFPVRVAAVLVAQEMSRFCGNNDFAKKHFEHYCQHFANFLDSAAEKLTLFAEGFSIDSYYCGDWAAHVDEAIARGGGIIAYPPPMKGEYERQYEFLDECVVWDAPTYEPYDPSRLDGILTKIEAAGIPYFILSDQAFENRKPILEFATGRKNPQYGYAFTPKSTVRHLIPACQQSEAFVYEPIDMSKLKPNSKVEIVPIEAKYANFIKDIYLAKTIKHTNGILTVFVLIDGMLAGCLVYNMRILSGSGRSKKMKKDALYLLTDVVLSNQMKLAKLVTTIATSREVVNILERRLFIQIKEVWTTARTGARPMSMKYRDVYQLHHRTESPEEGFICEYVSEVRTQSIKKMFKKWFEKYRHEQPGKDKKKQLAGAAGSADTED
ncbi:hypothetical protein H6G00_01740 [Leptolyngbya sp. FACHB-541]|uniref:putative antirestriction adenine methyltransferase n=1 Tax=Leptolyngbya sp. FACHB-541 TaxID=2692810 RepID=UPI0016820FF0|nr:hypothetical protein [Leptolyngbya sp. FACHB-541]MBD1995353.1 hypothetical protein [Leptolyngbya sp. FACHB-541]